MPAGRSPLLTLFVPPLLGGLAVSACAALILRSPPAAVFALGSALVAGMGTALAVSRQARDASALLRRPELRGSTAHRTGIFSEVLNEAIVLLEQHEAEASRAAQSRTELEARMHLRQRQARQLEGALAVLETAVLVTDSRDAVLHANPAAMRWFQSVVPGDRDSGKGSRPLEVERIPALKKLLEDARARNAANDRRTVEFEIDAAGQTRPFRATTVNTCDDEGRPVGAVTLLADVAEERRARTRHAEFVSSVVHELKTPMASIKAFTEMLLDGEVDDPQEQQELYGFIDLQVDRLTRMVNSMLNLTRIESGVIKVQREDCQLNDVLTKSLEVVRQLAEEKQIRLISELSELYLAVHVDAELFGQAVINLLSNAIKYTPNGGEVRLRSRAEEGEAIVEVRDTGMGIPPESLPRLFERFYRVPENCKAAAGTGLGLALVHYIVTELHGGRISVSSVVNCGSSFTAAIPLGHRGDHRKKLEATLAAT